MSDQRERDESLRATPRRGDDDRRGQVKPSDNPAPRSPEADEEAIRQGEEKLDSVKPY
jgi:hypothetical protein